MITVPRAAAALLTGAALALTAACADTEEDAKYDAPDATLTDAATAAAEEIAADYTFDKDSITVLSDLGGDEMDQFLSTYAPFEEATGITVEYEGTRDLLSVLQTRIGGGNPPDVVSNPSIGQMQQLIADGDLVPMDDVLDLPTVQEQYDPGLLDLATGADGELYGIFTTAAVKGLVYYDPTTYDGPTAPATWDELATWTDAEADAGRTPWCIGLESGAASGWPATDWIEQFLLTTDGPDVYDAWRTGELAWTSPEVREAFQAFLDVTTAEQANGGPTGVVSTGFLTAADPMYDEPPACSLHMQADWMSRTLPAQVEAATPVERLDFFQAPPVDPAQAGATIISGELLGAFDDSPEVQAFMRYSASVERQALLASTGLWIAPNKAVPQDAYPTELQQRAATIFSEATSVRFDASDTMPSDVNQAFWSATLTTVKDPSSLDAELEKLEQLRTAD
jgi:alpha-glucoside transport system substrate-binding protein